MPITISKDNRSDDAVERRKRAEDIARKIAAQSPEGMDALSSDEIRQTLHELRVHQIELEMQNEDLRRSHAELNAAQDRYFDLYNLAPVGYCTLSEKGLILDANLAAATLLGVTRGKLIMQPISRFILKEDQDTYYLHLKQLVASAELQECELRLVKPDGTHLWAHLTATAAQSQDGSPLCRIVISDITKRKLVEELLRRKNEELSTLLDALPVMTWIALDPECRCITGNRAVNELFGVSSGTNVSQSVVDKGLSLKIIHLDNDGQELRADQLPMQQAIATGQPVLNRELTYQLPDGRRIYALGNAVPLFDETGRTRGAIGSYLDITERKQAEEAQRESEWYLRSTVDGLPAHITVLDESGEIILTNKAYRDFAEQNGIDPRTVSEGANYLAICDTASGEHSDEAGPFADGIRL